MLGFPCRADVRCEKGVHVRAAHGEGPEPRLAARRGVHLLNKRLEGRKARVGTHPIDGRPPPVVRSCKEVLTGAVAQIVLEGGDGRLHHWYDAFVTYSGRHQALDRLRIELAGTAEEKLALEEAKEKLESKLVKRTMLFKFLMQIHMIQFYFFLHKV